MNVIAPRTLRTFWQEHKDAKKPLQIWYKTVRRNRYTNFNELKKDFGSVDYVSKREATIFDIGGNSRSKIRKHQRATTGRIFDLEKYRLVTFVRYTSQTIFIKHVFTHAEYDKWSKGKGKA